MALNMNTLALRRSADMAPSSAPRPPMGREGLRTALHVMPLVLLLYSVVVPPEMRIDLAGQTIYPHRAVLIALLPWVLVALSRKRIQFGMIDFLVFYACAWMIVSIILYHGIGSFASGTVNAFDTFIPYLVARLAIRDLTDLRRTLVMVAPGVLFAGLVLMVESVSANHILRPAAADLFGRIPVFEGGQIVGDTREDFVDYRLGLMRATGPFPHPILAGVFMVSLLPMYYAASLRGWPRWAGMGGALLSIFTVSSTTLLGLLIFAGLTAFDRIQRVASFLNWWLLMLGSTLFLAVLQFGSQAGAIGVLSRATLNPSTARYRELIWYYGVQSVENHPWIGIGYDDYERLSWMIPSVDANWLFLAIRNGLFTPVCLFIAFVSALVSVCLAARKRPDADRNLLIAVAISLFIVIIAGFAVAFFGGVQAHVYALVGLGVSLGRQGLGDVRGAMPVVRPITTARPVNLPQE